MTIITHALSGWIDGNDAHAKRACSRMALQATGHQTVEVEYTRSIRGKLLLLRNGRILRIRGIVVISYPQAILVHVWAA